MQAVRKQVTGIREGQTRFPRYDAAALGFENYWYPVMRSRSLRNRPISVRLFGRDIMFLREDGKAHAFEDRCPHRGVPLSLGKQEFAGTWTCRYHGWTFDLKNGALVAALTDGPESPICGKASIRVYRVEERCGLVWIYNGTNATAPVERDIPKEFLAQDTVIVSRITTRRGDWRHAAENGFDDGHAKYLHRTAWRAFFARLPGYSRVKVIEDEEKPWITRDTQQVFFEADYPGLGRWPKKEFWRRGGGGARLSIRLPGALRCVFRGPAYIHFEWYVPTDVGEHRYLQFLVLRSSRWRALRFQLCYWLYIRWLQHYQFTNQDESMVRCMKTPPEQLYRPDISLIAWRHLCERESAGIETGPTESPQEIYNDQEREQFELADRKA